MRIVVGVVKNRELAAKIRQVVAEKLGAHPTHIISFPVSINWLVVRNDKGYVALQKVDDNNFSLEAGLAAGGPRVRISVLSSSEEDVFLTDLKPEQAHRLLGIVPECPAVSYEEARDLLRRWGKR